MAHGAKSGFSTYEDAPLVGPAGRRSPVNASDPTTANFVAAKRFAGFGWGAIARMLDRSEHDVRVAFDPAYRPDPMWLRQAPPPRPPKARGAQAVRPVRPRTMEARVMLAIAASPGDTAQLMRPTGYSRDQVSFACQTLRDKGQIWGSGDAGWALTQAGVEQAALLQAYDERARTSTELRRKESGATQRALVLAQCVAGLTHPKAVAMALKVTAAMAQHRLSELHRLGLVTNKARGCWRPTEAGRAMAAAEGQAHG